jgi:hypothetical protein
MSIKTKLTANTKQYITLNQRNSAISWQKNMEMKRGLLSASGTTPQQMKMVNY